MNARVNEIQYALSYFRNTHNPCTGKHCFNCRRINELQDELLVISAQGAQEESPVLKKARKAGLNTDKMQKTTSQLIKLAEIAREQDMPEAEKFIMHIVEARP